MLRTLKSADLKSPTSAFGEPVRVEIHPPCRAATPMLVERGWPDEASRLVLSRSGWLSEGQPHASRADAACCDQ